MPRLRVRRVQFDEGRLDHLTKRATIREIAQVFANGPRYQHSLRGRVADYRAVGRTDAGRPLTIPFIYDEETRTAIPVTAYETPRSKR
jgi:hypothetical protein